ncbi:FecR family protein [Paremcibacter congregatus]|uniref:FecR family protein n=1 Tax=Paremcibacter congregatus TaxID=2043170 RepID=UPI003A92A27E
MNWFTTQKSSDQPVRPDEVHMWFTLMNSGEVTAEDKAEFAAWRLENPGLYERYKTLEKTWDMAKDVTPSMPPGLAEVEAGSIKYSRVLAALAACLLIFFFVRPTDAPAPSPHTAYQTAISQIDRVNLEDGSQVLLNARSDMKVAMSTLRRDITLNEGEALFSVAHDKHRPFVVKARNGEVQAIGTEFNVDIRNDFVHVVVLEGVVKVTRYDENGENPNVLIARAGEEISYGGAHPGKSEKIALKTVAEPAEAVAWQEGKLIFNGDKLQDVVEEIGRYTNTPISIADESLKELSLYGIFNARDTEGILAAISSALPVTIEHRGEEIILLRKKAVA